MSGALQGMIGAVGAAGMNGSMFTWLLAGSLPGAALAVGGYRGTTAEKKLEEAKAALERIRGASDAILAGGVALIGELQGVPDGLAVTDKTIDEVKVGAVRYAGSVAKLLG